MDNGRTGQAEQGVCFHAVVPPDAPVCKTAEQLSLWIHLNLFRVLRAHASVEVRNVCTEDGSTSCNIVINGLAREQYRRLRDVCTHMGLDVDHLPLWPEDILDTEALTALTTLLPPIDPKHYPLSPDDDIKL